MAKIATSQEFTREEVGLALRNHGMHLEGLRYPITPIGIHYLLIHFDIPFIDPETYELPIAGRIRNPLRLSLDDVKARPAVTYPVLVRVVLEDHPQEVLAEIRGGTDVVVFDLDLVQILEPQDVAAPGVGLGDHTAEEEPEVP